MAARGVEERAAFADAMTLIGALIGAAIGLAVMLSARDGAMAFHGLLFLIAGTLAGICVLNSAFATDGPCKANGLYVDGPIKVPPSPRSSGGSPASWLAR
jgi:hypothetical protein